MGMGQNLVPLVNIKIAGKWMFIPLKMVLIGIDPYPYENSRNWVIQVPRGWMHVPPNVAAMCWDHSWDTSPYRECHGSAPFNPPRTLALCMLCLLLWLLHGTRSLWKWDFAPRFWSRLSSPSGLQHDPAAMWTSDADQGGRWHWKLHSHGPKLLYPSCPGTWIYLHISVTFYTSSCHVIHLGEIFDPGGFAKPRSSRTRFFNACCTWLNSSSLQISTELSIKVRTLRKLLTWRIEIKEHTQVLQI